MNLKVPIAISDELTEEVIEATGLLDLASGEIHKVEYQDYDVGARGYPFESDAYEFSSGTLSNNGKDVEFRVDVNRTSGQYSVSASELLEIKVRAAALFAGISGQDMLSNANAKSELFAKPDPNAPKAQSARAAKAPARKSSPRKR